MAYDEDLAARVRDAVGERADFTEQKMFGGLAFMVHTHMAVGITRDELMVRVGTDGYDDALADGAHELRMGERVMHGMVGVPPSVTADEAALHGWVARGVDLALATPPKPPKR
ncbi:TfoX/Sxy family protein [Isoptericola sp. NPDC057653]|jgi:TfoX/Sxy family transcriptional regulator of competence genes|uniref:TfoX/Sxy family protein n=1 Tax=unclassified Isoptericola TaxID=2623355 RepID=UPI0036CE79EB